MDRVAYVDNQLSMSTFKDSLTLYQEQKTGTRSRR
jgi:hypothetical protein